MVENYTKDIKESVYHGAVVSALAIGYTMLGKTVIKMGPPNIPAISRYYTIFEAIFRYFELSIVNFTISVA